MPPQTQGEDFSEEKFFTLSLLRKIVNQAAYSGFVRA